MHYGGGPVQDFHLLPTETRTLYHRIVRISTGNSLQKSKRNKKAIAKFNYMGYNVSDKSIVFPWLGIAQVECLAEQDNGVEVPALPAL